MPNFRKKPITIEAIEYDGSVECGLNLIQWSDDALWYLNDDVKQDNKLCIMTLEGVMTASVGDYVIKGVHNEYYACKPDIFHKTYDSNLDDTQLVVDIISRIQKWDGEAETPLGKLLNEKVIEINKKRMGAWD